ncbi:MAG: hypothetical protein AB7T20_06225 [Steroidobacteraceae bacterium]
MEPDQDQPIAREPWQRLLRERYDAPPEVTDARIRQAARRALAPRPSRWWLPASLAASVLLAVMLVQWQYGDDRAPDFVTESDVAAPMSAAPAAMDAAESAGRAQEARQAPATDAAIVPPSVPPPLLELPKYDSTPAASAERETPVTGITAGAPAQAVAPATPAPAAESRSFGKLGGLKESREAPRDPEEWYEEIEALRAQGHSEEADAELASLEAAWPGWLEKNHPQNR